MNPHDPNTPDDTTPADPHEPIDPRLEDAMRALTDWPEQDAPRVWERALDAAQAPTRPTVLARLRRRHVLGAAAALFLIVMITHSLIQQNRFTSASETAEFGRLSASAVPAPPPPPPPAIAGSERYVGAPEMDFDGVLRAPSMLRDDARDTPAGRLVATRITMELRVENVRVAFTKLLAMCSEVRGEHVQESSLTGEGPTAAATATLRIEAARLSAFLNDARQLGDVESEQSTGEDVTDRAVDLDARLRNEQRVESELLELLESREDAPLDEILAVRDQLGRVRTTIERLIAQRQTLAKQVRLSRVTVILRPTDEALAPEPTRQGIGGYIAGAFDDAWHRGLRSLVDSVAWLAHTAVAGLLWWLALAVFILVIIRTVRSSDPEPASADATS